MDGQNIQMFMNKVTKQMNITEHWRSDFSALLVFKLPAELYMMLDS